MAGDSFDSVKSVHEASLDVYAPVLSGMIVDINKVMLDEPALVNE
jgi:glycine cleavage system H lipoate-binding protein